MAITQPRWKTPEYSATQIDKAGIAIQRIDLTEEEKERALIIIDNWRSSHAYPLHVFYMNLRNKASMRNDIIVAERLKRLDSIIEKLKRQENMKLSRMQDLGGCRMVLPTIDEVYLYSNKLINSSVRHELKRTYDYIKDPKETGYRSLHLVYKFRTETEGKEVFNNYPMFIELQFRTHLQHIWATAVESIGYFTNQALKAGQGEELIKRFFVLVSSLFAIREKSPVIPGTSSEQAVLISEIKEIDKKVHVIDLLSAIRAAIDHEGDNIPDKKGYYILRLDYNKRTLRKIFFKPSEIELANKTYDFLESNKDSKYEDIVLVRATSIVDVKKAYPNYFMDIGEFVSLVNSYLEN